MGPSYTEVNGLVDLTGEPQRAPSPIRAKILKESIAAARKERGTSQRQYTWTKKPKYDGFQSTLDLNNGLRPLRPSKALKEEPPTLSFVPSFAGNCENHNDTFTGSRSVEPTMLNMESTVRNSDSFDESEDPVMRELEDIVRKCREEQASSGDINSIPIGRPQTPGVAPTQPDTLWDTAHESRPISQEQLAREVQCE